MHALALNKTINLFPVSLPDEIHASQVGRLHRDSGNLSTRQTFLDAYGTAPFRITQWIPTNLEKFAERLTGSLKDNLHQLLQDNTIFPLFATFGNASLKISEDCTPLRDQIINMPKRIVGETGKSNICIECLRDDLKSHEKPFIHRSHQTPAVKVCWRHKTRLLSACPFCGCPFEHKADLVMAPWEPCPACGQFLLNADFYKSPEDAAEREVEFAQFAYELLQKSKKTLPPNTLATMYFKKIVEKGLNRGTMIDKIAVQAALEEHFGTAFISDVDSAYRNGRTQNWLRFCSTSGVFDAPLSRHLLLANFLFGSCDEFLKTAESVFALPSEQANEEGALGCHIRPTCDVFVPTTSVDNASILFTNTPPATESSEKLNIVSVISACPGITLANLWKHHHRVMKQFLKREPDGMIWLLEQLKTTAVTLDSSNLQPHQGMLTSEDLSLAKKFAATALELYSSLGKPIKITRSYLMHESGLKQSNLPDPERFPLASKQLNSLSESNWHYHARRIIWAKLTINVVATSASTIIIPAGIEHHRGLALLEFFSNVPSNRGLREGTIADILSEYGIDKQWEGPDPVREFYTPGRNYVRGHSANAIVLMPPQLP